MREATAHYDDDFSAVEQQRPARRKSAPRKQQQQRAGLLGGLRRKPMRAIGVVAVVALLGGIAVNATLFQNARHPAPLFAAAPERAQSQKTAAAPEKAATPMPAPRPAEMATIQATPAPRVASAPAVAPRPPVREQAEAAPANRKDPIAALIKGESPEQAAPSPKIAAAQRALQKVGFVVKPDGVFGAGTRQALERFERDRGLPVTGELAGRTVKELSAQSGVAIP